MTGPREWRHAEGCPKGRGGLRCTCGLSAVRDATAQGHRVVVGPDGVEGRLIGTWLAGDYEIVPLEEPSPPSIQRRVMDKHCGICGATTEPLQPETGGVLGGFMECVDAVACLIRAAQVDEPEAALASPVDPEEEP